MKKLKSIKFFMSRLTFRQFLNIGALEEKNLGKIFLLGFLLPRFKNRTAGNFEDDEKIKNEILAMKPEGFFEELEKDLTDHPEEFGGPGPERVRKIIAEVKAIIPGDEGREGKIRYFF